MKNLKTKLIVGFLVGGIVISQLVTISYASWYRFR
ncbi:UNVERIFIED_CONTAM: hypothetical protein Cloal_2365 [Acetivibrio alkalicellulosi]